MANLTPVAGWDPVTQLETNTPALGGPGAIMNAQAQALLNRTEMLNADKVETVDLASTTDVAKGAALQGFAPALNYAAATTGAALQDGMVNVMWFLTAAERAQVKSNGTTIDLTPKINAAKTWGGNRMLYLPAGTWSFTSIDGRGWYGGIVGDGVNVTILKVRSSVAAAIEFGETSDVIISPFVLKHFTLDGNSLAATGINVRYRHESLIESVYVVQCTQWGVVEKDAWNNRRIGLRCTINTNGMWLVGSNHNSQWIGCTWSGSSGMQLYVQTAGTANDGNDGLTFVGCAAVDGTGQGIDIACTSASFVSCYLGENIGGVSLIFRSGNIMWRGGVMFFGSTASSFLFAPAGGRVLVEGAKINGQTFGSTNLLNSPNTGGKWSFRDCVTAFSASGDQTIANHVLDFGPPGIVFAKRLGRLLTSSATNATRTELISGNSITATCATVSTSPNMTITATLSQVHPEWIDGGTLFLVVEYLSNAAFSVRFSGGALGAAPTTAIGVMPATAGAARTYVKIDAALAASNYDRIEFYRDGVVVGEYLKIEKICVADDRMLNKGAGAIGNLYLC